MDITATDAKQRFSAVIAAAVGGDRVNITRHGDPVISIVAAHRMDELERSEQALRAAAPQAAALIRGGGS